jgi:hypothetical protein
VELAIKWEVIDASPCYVYWDLFLWKLGFLCLHFHATLKKYIYIISRLIVTNIFWVLYCSIWKVSLCVQWMDKWEKYLWEMESWAKSNGILRSSASMNRVFIEIHVIEHIYWAHHYMCLCAQRPLIGSLIPHRYIYIYIGVQYLSLWHLILSLTS